MKVTEMFDLSSKRDLKELRNKIYDENLSLTPEDGLRLIDYILEKRGDYGALQRRNLELKEKLNEL